MESTPKNVNEGQANNADNWSDTVKDSENFNADNDIDFKVQLDNN